MSREIAGHGKGFVITLMNFIRPAISWGGRLLSHGIYEPSKTIKRRWIISHDVASGKLTPDGPVDVTCTWGSSHFSWVILLGQAQLLALFLGNLCKLSQLWKCFCWLSQPISVQGLPSNLRKWNSGSKVLEFVVPLPIFTASEKN